MNRIQTLVTMILFISTFLVFFYSTLHLEVAHGHRAAGVRGTALRNGTLRVLVGDVKTQAPKQESLSTAPPLNASTSNGLRQMIPQNTAYWNRLLHSALNGSRPEVRWSRCREMSRELLETNIHDFSSYPALFQTFLEGMNCRAPPVLIGQPKKCLSGTAGGEQTFLLFAIKSSPENFARRQAVRETWGREGVYPNGLRVRTVFLIGSSLPDEPDLGLLLSAEAQLFSDLLQWDFYETFLNLTLKMSTFLEWARESCPRVSFVFSGDDDVFVNTPLVLSYLQAVDPSRASRLYVGQVINSANPLRDSKSKYYVPLSFYQGAYPGYAGGGGFIFSGALLQPLHSLSLVMPFFPIDDVYMGMSFKALGVSPEAHAGFQTFDVKSQDRENLCIHKALMLVHQRMPSEIKKLWRGIQSPLLTC
ncbi:N-acetyllactosaminide beta-1,3-N-acetylglucosaminyltransferase 2 [Salarias fasciatus]|uniref:Hexosyltransferase n=1 Tax=Salarias fasciatus TaxID=181472 RepID=A0A672IX03_SALFA|nr:UDP-GlcNAc:betaGal beta-1,3-N-acetylglucosaminyltransferase 8 [Salarias fasciatus]